MGIEIVYLLYELCINLVKLNVMLIKNDVYDIFEKIKALMIHGKYKAEKIYIEIVFIMETRTQINKFFITNRRLDKSLCLFMF